MFFSLKQQAFGLDISDLSLRIANLEKKGGELTLASFEEARIPPGVIEEGEIKNEKRLAEIIQKAISQVKGKKLKTNYVVSSLPEEKSFSDVLQIPRMTEEEIAKAVGFEIENHIPLKIDEVYFDFEKIEPIFGEKKYLEVLVVACPQKIVKSYLKTLKLAKLQPRALELECQALTRALILKEESREPLLIIDFGESRTTFIIFSGKSLRFTSTIPISSQALSEAISRTLDIGLEKAERLKQEQGLVKKELFEAMIPTLTDLKEQIETRLNYYYTHEKGNHVLPDGRKLKKILLCGGGANLKGLIEFLTSQLKIKIEIANPWVNIFKKPLKKIPQLSFKKSLSYATTLGLALRGFYGY
ncbi:MAG: type IV pilus assembly protein PilM [Patescibacteria group bacterium]|nr:type IV pilus assembly protein PilM [Patescibacteria group bacterium]